MFNIKLIARIILLCLTSVETRGFLKVKNKTIIPLLQQNNKEH